MTLGQLTLERPFQSSYLLGSRPIFPGVSCSFPRRSWTSQLHRENHLNRIKAPSSRRLKLSRSLFWTPPGVDSSGCGMTSKEVRCKALQEGSSHRFLQQPGGSW